MKLSLVVTGNGKRKIIRGACDHHRRSGWLAMLWLATILAACSGFASVQPVPTAELLPSATATASVTPFIPATATPLPPTATPSPAPTATPLPLYRPTQILRGIAPVSYLKDSCQALQYRWDPEKAAPGTMVIPVMFHSVVKDGRTLTDNISIHETDLKNFMDAAKQLGYETITSAQLLDFLQNNTAIPARSLLLIVDDRRQGVIWNNFIPFLQQYNWKVTLAYITGPAVSEQEWKELKRLDDTGYVDVQAHGYLHNGESYITEYTKPDIVTQELVKPIEQIEKYLGETPVAFIWPGGNYTPQSVHEARDTGYQLGFTVRARGPIMFDWIPQGEEELAAGDPLLTLPRYWSTNAYNVLYDAIKIAEEVQQNAAAQKSSELEWYADNCPGYPAIH